MIPQDTEKHPFIVHFGFVKQFSFAFSAKLEILCIILIISGVIHNFLSLNDTKCIFATSPLY